MSRYNLETVSYPSLTGTSLRLFAALLDNPLLRPLLLPQLLKQGGLSAYRALSVDSEPAFLPLHPAGESRGVNLASLVSPPQDSAATKANFCSAPALAMAYRQGQTTPLEITQRALNAIDEADQGPTPLRAFVEVERERALQEAAAATERIASGKDLGILDGVPMAFKDEFDVAGFRTGVGTRFLGRAAAATDATVVSRLRRAGVVVLGKTNMHEIGISPRSGNPHHGTVRNPYNPGHDAGGSSSGSAAAVAAGICPLAIGADGGGSIRIPAAMCGLVGLKATFGRISSHGSFPLDWSVGHLGPIGATVADVALAYAAIAGPDQSDPNTLAQPPLKLGDGGLDAAAFAIKGLRIGVDRAWFEHAEPAVVDICRTAVEAFAASGADIVEIEVPRLDELRVAHAVTILSEMASSMANYPDSWKELSAPTRISLRIGRAASSVDYLKAQKLRAAAMHDFASLFTEVDAIATPASAILPPEILPASLATGVADLGIVTELMRFAFPANMTGHPALSFPVGYADGLPVGLQLTGRPWEEGLLLSCAALAEASLERQLPPAYVSLLGA